MYLDLQNCLVLPFPLLNVRLSLQSMNTSGTVAFCRRLSCFVCYRTHSSAGLLVSEIENMAKGCPPPDTRSKATIFWNQMGGREIVGQSTSKQHYFHFFSAASAVLSTHGSFNSESAIVSAPQNNSNVYKMQQSHWCSLISCIHI